MSATEPPSGEGPSNNGRSTGGRFANGNGYGHGRPHGSRNNATIICEQLFDKSGRKLTKIAIEKAEAGDPWALRLAIERILPPRRERPRPFAYTTPRNAAEVPAAIDSILAQMADGALTASEGAAIISGIEALRSAYATADLEARVKALEQGRAHEPDRSDREA
jgi:hypothetical protein